MTCLMMPTLLLATLCTAAAGKIIYVDDDTTGANDGSSWENAYIYLQDAMADANSAEKPVEIRVAQGIYKPDQGAYQTPGDREATFRLINGVTLIGGYAGLGGPDPNTRDVELYETILSGDLNGNDVQVDIVEVADLEDLESESTRMENSYHVITGSGTDDSAGLDGFTITAGYAYGPEGPGDDHDKFRSGGGMYNISGNPIVANCIFTMNAVYKSGGGIFNYDCSLTLTGCKFTGNLATWGGGMDNDDSRLILTNCTFGENLAERGGGISNSDYLPSTLKLTDCAFIRNLADFCGGGMDGGIATLTNCAFIENEAFQGGGLSFGLLNLTNCSFIANKARGWGGGMWPVSYNMSNCTLSGNSAGITGGAIFMFYSELNLTNCTLTGNSAPKGNALASDEFHGGLSNVELTNCIVWGSSNEIWNDVGSNIAISYSDIKGGQDDIYDPYDRVVWGQGNIDADPLFADPGYWVNVNDPNIIVEPNDPNNELWVDGDYHLKSEAGRWNPVGENWVTDDVTSPCIDAGDPNSPLKDEPEPNGGIINMGAYGSTPGAGKSPSGIHNKYNGSTYEPYDPAVNAAVILEGLGTAQQPYLIRDANELGAVWFRPKAHYRLEADLDLSGITWPMAVVPWFGGTFDGNGHVISNLYICGAGDLGLFGILDSGAIVSNLGMEAVDIDGISAGGLVGYNREGSISSCYSTGTVRGSWDTGGLTGFNSGSITSSYSTCDVAGSAEDIGGLVGHNRGNISTSYSTGAVSGDKNIGGLVGFNLGDITMSYSTGTVIGGENIGGLAGYNRYSMITTSYSMCAASGDKNVGGLVGNNYSTDITACYSTGKVTGNQCVGGLVGIHSEAYTIDACFSTGEVSGKQVVGGLVGENWGFITKSYSIGAVSGDLEVGGLIGTSNWGIIYMCFWDMQTSGQAMSSEGYGKTTIEMQTASTFLDAGWDFIDETANGTEDIWWILEGQDYPRLWWETE
jgi:hypothetical protein